MTVLFDSWKVKLTWEIGFGQASVRLFTMGYLQPRADN